MQMQPIDTQMGKFIDAIFAYNDSFSYTSD